MAFFLVDSKRLYRSSEKEEESRCLVSTSSTKRDQAFSSRSRAVTAKKCTKKRDARAQKTADISQRHHWFLAKSGAPNVNFTDF